MPVQDSHYSDLPEKEFIQFASKDHSRRLGQYFTPYPLARFMAEWVNQAPSLRHVIDPAVGLGIFFRALMEVNPGFSGDFIGFDVDSSMLDRLRQMLPTEVLSRLHLHAQDFLLTDDDKVYDGILCNPPYIRYKAILERESLRRQIESRYSVTLSRYSNIYVYFILRCTASLSPGGRAAILVPSDFLYSGFGEPIKKFLLSSGALRYVVVFDQNDSLFEDAITTSCLLLLANDGRDGPPAFITVHSPADLEPLTRDIACLERSAIPMSIISPESISPAEKWSRYFSETLTESNLRHVVPMAQLGRVVRGIACGDNRFFTFTRSKITATGIPESYFLPCLSRAAQARQPFFQRENFNQLAQEDKPVFLLDACQNPDHPNVKAYLKLGEQNGSHLRYLTRHRTPWYRLENRPPAPILAATFNRKDLRFVRNEAGVRNLTCFHSIYPHPGLEHKADLLMAYLLTPLAHSLIRRNRRRYGGGLIKYEPNDLNSVLAADLRAIPEEMEKAALIYYSQFRRSCLDNEPDYALIWRLDAIFREWITTA